MEYTPRDIGIYRKLGSLDGYKYLSSTAIFGFTKDLGRNEGKLLNRLTTLRRDRGEIGRDDELKAEADLHYRTRDAVYQITSRGRAVLLDHDIEPTTFSWCTGPLEHDFGTCSSVSSIELACKDSGIEFISPSHFAKQAGAIEHPFSFSNIRIKHRGKTATVDFHPDWPPFALRYPNGNVLLAVGFETDRGTETNSPEDLNHSSVLRHVLCYQQLDEQSSFVGRYKLKNRRYYVLIQTSSELRKRNMMAALEKEIGRSAVFLFHVTPKFARFSSRSAPTAELMTTPWERIGHPPIVLSTYQEG